MQNKYRFFVQILLQKRYRFKTWGWEKLTCIGFGDPLFLQVESTSIHSRLQTILNFNWVQFNRSYGQIKCECQVLFLFRTQLRIPQESTPPLYIALNIKRTKFILLAFHLERIFLQRRTPSSSLILLIQSNKTISIVPSKY